MSGGGRGALAELDHSRAHAGQVVEDDHEPPDVPDEDDDGGFETDEERQERQARVEAQRIARKQIIADAHGLASVHGYRVPVDIRRTFIRRAMADGLWVRGKTARKLATVWRLHRDTIRRDAAVAWAMLRDPADLEAAKERIALRSIDWADEAHAGGEYDSAGRLLELHGKVTGAITSGPTLNLDIKLLAAFFDPRSGELTEAGRAKVDDDARLAIGSGVTGAAQAAADATLAALAAGSTPEEARQAGLQAGEARGWEMARARGVGADGDADETRALPEARRR